MIQQLLGLGMNGVNCAESKFSHGSWLGRIFAMQTVKDKRYVFIKRLIRLMTRHFKHLPPLQGLLTFHTVAVENSFSGAAKVLHVTQGAVSHRIRALEDELGFALFLRRSRSVELTEQGQILFTSVADAFSRLNAAVIELESISNQNRVAVSCSPSFAIRWLVPRMGKLRDDLPDIEVHVASDDRLVDLSGGSVDLCIRFGPGGYDGVDSVRLTQENVYAVCSPLYLAQHNITGIGQLERCTLLHADVLSEHSEHVGWKEWTEAVTERAVVGEGVHFNHAHMALEAATAGQGVALGRTTITADSLRRGALVRVSDDAVQCGFSYWLLRSKRRERSAVASFCEWILAELNPDRRVGAAYL